MKQEIKQMTAVYTGDAYVVFGLGADNKVYVWRADHWAPHVG
jgi:hypothetical protein